MILRTMPQQIFRRPPPPQPHQRYGIVVMAMTILLLLLQPLQQLLTIQQSQSNSNSATFLTMVHAMPYVLLKNKAPYCFSTDHMIQPHTTYTIDFHAPDMIVIDETTEDGEKINQENLSYNNIIPPEHRNQNNDGTDPSAAMDALQEHQQAIIDRGLDIRYQERQQKRYDILKRSVCVTIYELKWLFCLFFECPFFKTSISFTMQSLFIKNNTTTTTSHTRI
jgi:hypothetical protein